MTATGVLVVFIDWNHMQKLPEIVSDLKPNDLNSKLVMTIFPTLNI